MIQELKDLKEKEWDLIYKAPILTCILISGADGVIDEKEIRAAIKSSKKNAKRKRAMLYLFYSELAENFESILNKLIKEYPDNTEDRNKKIIDELSDLNQLFLKLDKTFSIVYYTSLREIAHNIAKSSGGILWMNSISKEEKEFIDLPMIDDPTVLF